MLVPRHAERTDEVIRCLEDQGLAFIRRSEVGNESFDAAQDRPDVLLVDTTGELRNFYSVADIIFVGKSLSEHGGHGRIPQARGHQTGERC